MVHCLIKKWEVYCIYWQRDFPCFECSSPEYQTGNSFRKLEKDFCQFFVFWKQLRPSAICNGTLHVDCAVSNYVYILLAQEYGRRCIDFQNLQMILLAKITYYTVKKASGFPVPSLAGNNLNFFRPGKVWLVTSQLGTGKLLTFFLQCSIVYRGAQMNNFGHSIACRNILPSKNGSSWSTLFSNLYKIDLLQNPGVDSISPPKPIASRTHLMKNLLRKL